MWNKQKGMRLLSAFIDLICIVLFAFLTFIAYDAIYLKRNAEYTSSKETIFTMCRESNLYEENGSSLKVIEKDYDYHLKKFYENHPYDVTSGNVSYEASKEKSGYFVLSGETWTLKENLREDGDGVRDFFAKEMELAISTFSKDETFQNALKVTSKKESLGQDIALFGSCTVFLLVIPLFLKAKGSIGKLICKLTLVSKHGNPIHFVQIFVRYLILMIVVIYFSTFMYGVFMLIEAGAILLTKEGNGLEDFLADTRVLTYSQVKEREEQNHEKENG